MKTAITMATWHGLGKLLDKKYTWQEIVKEIAQAGYDGVELGGTEERMGPARDVVKFVNDQGLQISTWFVSVTYNPWPPNTAEYRKTIEYAAQIGVSHLSCCGGFMPNQRRNTYSFDYDLFATNFGNAMKYAKKFGMEIAFHPHRGCVVETIAETQKMVDRLPDFRICVDTAHLEASGEDAMAFIRKFRKRIIATHIKDYSWKRDSFMEPGKGDGKLDVAACVKELKKGGYDGWMTIELDKKWDGIKKLPTPLENAKMCRRFLKTCGY
jgi:inosose dehydratase